ncbi:MAG: hypothetical protein A2Y40_10730 [Candidatus Margulisbacteria bacterium GWF2_35_9]|nr:MAG: hypothetical protein A2Y40_10730 [Candidatus Margulisbacteria bacterium GWF2_35_9]
MIDNPIWGNIFKKDKESIREYLKKVPIFDNLSNMQLKKIESFMFIRKYMLNEYIFRQNEPGAGMYIIKKGEVDIHLELGIRKVKELALLRTGDFFGEMALLDESMRSASAVAISDQVEVISFFRGDLLKVIQEYPSIACKILWNIGKVISTRMRKSNELLNSYQKQDSDETNS